MRRLGRMHALGVFAAAVVLVLVGIAISIRVELVGHLYADAANAPTTPVALILGAEVYADGRPSPALSSRLDVGIELEHQRTQRPSLKRERPSAEAEGRSSGGRTGGYCLTS